MTFRQGLEKHPVKVYFQETRVRVLGMKVFNLLRHQNFAFNVHAVRSEQLSQSGGAWNCILPNGHQGAKKGNIVSKKMTTSFISYLFPLFVFCLLFSSSIQSSFGPPLCIAIGNTCLRLSLNVYARQLEITEILVITSQLTSSGCKNL